MSLQVYSETIAKSKYRQKRIKLYTISSKCLNIAIVRVSAKIYKYLQIYNVSVLALPDIKTTDSQLYFTFVVNIFIQIFMCI